MSLRRFIFPALALSALVFWVFAGCQESEPVGADGLSGPRRSPVENLPPETHLSISLPEGQLPEPSSSNKTLHWWGEDVDGRVVGYLYRWGKLEFDPVDSAVVIDTSWIDTSWVETSLDSGVFVLPIRSATATFTFQVRAVDDAGAIDQSPAAISFPVFNSPPEVRFRPFTNPMGQSGEAYTFYTFDVHTFQWDGSDLDGQESIKAFYYALDPQPGDTSWLELPNTASSITLRDEMLTPGSHVFWLKAEDIAGFESERIHFPDSTVASDPVEWVVKQPAGEYLIVDDYAMDFPPDDPRSYLYYYRAIFDSLYNGGSPGEGDIYSVWELSDTQLPSASADVTETLLKFRKILWFSYYGIPKLTDAFNSMYSFINTPGNRMVLTTMSVDTGMVVDLADSLFMATSNGRLTSSPTDTVRMIPADAAGLLPVLELVRNDIIGRNVYAFEPSATAEVIYRLDESTSTPPQYAGTPVIGIRRQDKSYTIISVPLVPFRGGDNIGELIRVLLDE
ncbi:MAG TPA: hypothetical protein ENL08_06065 [Bacteroidetes bacterium]|nr:hypothetical protein [Bacteroidota bacterium]